MVIRLLIGIAVFAGVMGWEVRVIAALSRGTAARASLPRPARSAGVSSPSPESS